jgi:glutathione-independent formaldehyde dehydrogenase
MAGVKAGSVVYIAGAGPVGLACASSCQLLGAAIVIVGDLNEERLAHARSFGCETINLPTVFLCKNKSLVGVPT